MAALVELPDPWSNLARNCSTAVEKHYTLQGTLRHIHTFNTLQPFSKPLKDFGGNTAGNPRPDLHSWTAKRRVAETGSQMALPRVSRTSGSTKLPDGPRRTLVEAQDVALN